MRRHVWIKAEDVRLHEALPCGAVGELAGWEVEAGVEFRQMQVEQPPSQKREGTKQRRLDRSGRAKMKPPNKHEGCDGQHPCKHQPDDAKFRVLRIETRSEENRDE